MPRRIHFPKADRRRALELLASCRDGCMEAIMLAHGFSIDMMVEMVNAGLASVTTERASDRGRPAADHQGRAARAKNREVEPMAAKRRKNADYRAGQARHTRHPTADGQGLALGQRYEP